jgi:hypothetical protein
MSTRDEHKQTWDEDQRRRVARFFDLLLEADRRQHADESEPARRSADTAAGAVGSLRPRPEG